MHLHIVHGEGAAASVQQALGLQDENLVVLPDPLSVGPLARFSSAEAWAELRLPFLRDVLLPDALVDFTRASIGPLPVLRQALERMLSRYPDLDSGLSRWDRILLDKASSNGPRAVMVIASTLAEAGWDQDPVGDMWLYWRLRRLADTSLRSPLLELSGDASDYRKVNVRLTDAGYAVNRREVSALALNGVDDIIGGVHLSSDADRVWASDGRDLVRLKQLPPPVF